MNHLINQFRRIMSDDGRGDRNFTKQETRLREAQQALRKATDELQRAAELLQSEILSRGGAPLNLN